MPIKKKILFINDTIHEANPGCQAVSATIRELLKHVDIVGALPLGHWQNEFADIPGALKRSVLKVPGFFAKWSEETSTIDVDVWEKRRADLCIKDLQLKELLAYATHVVINGEGCIHHNFPRALALLALAQTCMLAGKKTYILNATIMGMDINLLRKVLPSLELLHVRESASFEYLKGLNSNIHVSPDIVFSAEFQKTLSQLPQEIPLDRSCLLTAGVVGTPKTTIEQLEEIQNAGLFPVYFQIGDGGDSVVAQEACLERNVPILSSNIVPWYELPSFLSKFFCAVSGRHHINIFLLLAGVPFVPLPSNTWKIEATLEMVNYPFPIAYNRADLQKSLQELLPNHAKMRITTAESGRKGRDLARSFLSQELLM